MEIRPHYLKGVKAAEVIAENLLLQTPEDALDLIGNLSYQGFGKIILHARNISPAFFELKTGLAGEILQKFVQYQMPLIIIGDFSRHSSQSLAAFIRESNRGSSVNFLADLPSVDRKRSYKP